MIVSWVKLSGNIDHNAAVASSLSQWSTKLDNAVSSFQLSSAALSTFKREYSPNPSQPNWVNPSALLWSSTSKKLIIPSKISAAVHAIRICPGLGNTLCLDKLKAADQLYQLWCFYIGSDVFDGRMSDVIWFQYQIGRAVTRSSLEQKVCGSNLKPIKSDTVLSTARNHCDISSKGVALSTGAMRKNGPRTHVTRFGVIQRV